MNEKHPMLTDQIKVQQDELDELGNKLIRAYQMAGAGFLAYRLEKIFRPIETNEDKALHNDMLAEIELMTGDRFGFLRQLSRDTLINNSLKSTRKAFLEYIASILMRCVKIKGKSNAKENN